MNWYCIYNINIYNTQFEYAFNSFLHDILVAAKAAFEHCLLTLHFQIYKESSLIHFHESKFGQTVFQSDIGS